MQEILFSNKLFKRVLLLIVLTVLLIFAVFNIDQLMGILKRAVGIMTPFFLGIVFAFILNLVVKLFEERVFARLNEKNGKIWKKCRRAVCILIALSLIHI